MASLIKRGSTYYLQYSLNGKVRRVSTGTDSFQLAKGSSMTVLVRAGPAGLRRHVRGMPFRYARPGIG